MNIPIETLLAELERLENIEDERDAIYEDYQDLGKECYKIQQELEKEKNKQLQKQLNGAFDRGFISKDKIREAIKELTNSKHYNYVGTEWKEAEVVALLEELLEEN